MELKVKRKSGPKLSGLGVIVLVFLVLYTAVMLAFLLFGIFSSVNTREVYNNKTFFPGIGSESWVWAFSNYSNVFENFVIDNELLYNGTIGYSNFYSMAANSVIVAGGGAVVSALCCFLVAYVTTKFPYFFSKIIYTFVIIAMVIPIIGATPSNIVVLTKLHLYQTIWGELIMKFNFMGMYYLVFCAVIQGLSGEYSEAAELDGASEFAIMVKIIFPLVMPTFFTIFLIRFIESWNDYNYIILYLKSYPTLSYGVYKMSIEKVKGMDHATMRIASSMLVAIPILTLFIIFRKKIMGNVTMGGVKE